MTQGATRVLYVDDDVDDQVILRDLLEDAEGSFELECVSTYEAALDRLLSESHDVFLLDYRLDHRTGLDLLREAGQRGNRIPVVMLTGRGCRSLDVQASELGAVDYLVKDQIDAQVLERTIRYAVRTAHTTQALRDSEERYVLAAQGANDGLWDWNLRTNTISFSPRWKTIFGYAEDDIGDDPREWLGRIHPEDREQTEAAIADHVRGRTDHFENTHRIRHADGTYHWVLVRASAARTHDGEAYRMAGSHMDVTKLRNAEQQLLAHSFFDEPTGLPNRNLLLDRAAVVMEHADATSELQCAMLALRVDAATSVGLNLGQKDSDRFIAEAVSRFRKCVRPGDTIARLGDDEFGILLTDINDITSAMHIAERLRDAMRLPLAISDGEVTTTITIGIAETTGTTSEDDLLSQAMAALAQARAEGGDRIRTFDAQLHAHSVASMQLEAELRRAINDGALTVYYQPIVSLRTSHITSFEALVRWQHPQRGLLPPCEFIPLAEATDMVCALDRFVLQTATKQLAEWHHAFPKAASLAVGVNYSSRHFVDPVVAISILSALRSADLKGAHLRLELTESALLEDPDVAIGIFNELAETGVGIVIDDFGTGFSSLSYLQRLPVSAVKIDQSFVGALTTSSANADIVRSIIGMARGLGFDVIAEGVEHRDQVEHLRMLDCDEAQGFLLGHPVDSSEATALLAEHNPFGDTIIADLGLGSEDTRSLAARPMIDAVGVRTGTPAT